MKLYKFKRVYESHGLRSILEDYNLSQCEIDEIVSRIDGSLFFYDQDLDDMKLNFIDRLSVIPLFVISFIMITVIMPIKWMFTGKYLFDAGKPAWFYNWISKF